AIVYGALGILRGDNHARPIYRGDSEFTVALLMPVAWHIGGLARYLFAVAPRYSPQKAGEIVGELIEVHRIATGKLPLLAQDRAGALGNDQHGDHAERMRHFQIACEILENRSAARVHLMAGKETLIHNRPRLRLKLSRRDIEDSVEVLFDPK